MNDKEESICWRICVPDLFNEITSNPIMSDPVIRIPLNMLQMKLAEIAQRAIELNDPKLNTLMMQLALYEQGNPYSKEYNSKLLSKMERENLG